MRNIILGTAGHIDHGKTTLIKNLTGINTDTLPEESARGMTINLGFAYYTTANGKKVGIIDVPGHEKFIKNMVAGATGIDFIILVIACDDGIMPQTREHFNILKILGIEKGVIALTKRDLVDEERAEILKGEIREEFKGSFLEGAEIIELSSKQPESYEKLKSILDREIERISAAEEKDKKFRLAVDRVFTVKGFGTVVTGTSLSGEVKTGDTLILYPTKKKVRVKGIENHGVKIESIGAGNRAALNLAGIDAEEIKRGDILSEDDSLLASEKVDVYLTLLGNKKKIKNNHRIRLHLGTSEVIGRVKLLGCDELSENSGAFAQLELEQPIIAVPGDIGVIRNYSPMDTIGGVKLLNVLGEKTKRNNQNYINKLNSLLKGNDQEKILELLKGKGRKFVTLQEIRSELGIEVTENQLLMDEIIFLNDGNKIKYIHRENFKQIEEKASEYLENYHMKNPLKTGVQRSEIKEKFFQELSIKEYNEVLYLLERDGKIILKDEFAAKPEYKVKLTKDQKKMKDEILLIYKGFGFSPEKISEIEKNFISKKEFKEMHEYLLQNGLLLSLGDDTYIMKGFFKESETRLRKYMAVNQKITLGEFRNLLDTSRKYALLLLDKFDELGITKRQDDYRILK